MAIPDHVKKEAMDAINDAVTTAQIRLYCNNDRPAVFTSPDIEAPVIRGPIPDHVKMQAMDAINDRGTQTQIRMMEWNGEVSPPVGLPIHGNNHVAQKITHLHQMGHDLDSVHKNMTRDDFGRECA